MLSIAVGYCTYNSTADFNWHSYYRYSHIGNSIYSRHHQTARLTVTATT